MSRALTIRCEQPGCGAVLARYQRRRRTLAKARNVRRVYDRTTGMSRLTCPVCGTARTWWHRPNEDESIAA